MSGESCEFVGMSLRYIAVSAVCSALSFAGLQWWMLSLLSKNGLGLGDAGRVVEVLVGSNVTIALLINLALNAYILLVLCLKMLFFKQLYASESRKLMEQLINYVIYKGTFLPLVVPPNFSQTVLWSTWLVVLCSLKMLQSLAKDRLERLNASPTTTPIKYFRVFSALLLVLAADMFWLKLCMVVYTSFRSSLFLLLFFEPFSIAFETLLAIMIHGFHLIEIWHRHSVEDGSDCLESHDFYKSAAGSLTELKGQLIRNCGFLLDVMALLMGVGHYVIIWWLHGMAFHLVDAILFLNLRAILSALVKRVKGFIKLKKALNSLDGSLPDATTEELSEFNDECAICRGPMARAKKLPCNHLFHLACLRSWLDQGLTEVYSCPTCRRPLFTLTQDRTNSIDQQIPIDGQITEHTNLRDDHRRILAHASPASPFPNQQQNFSDTMWRVGFDSSWVSPWTNSRIDGASTSSAIRSVGLSGVQMMMRQLASVSENYAHSSSMDSPFWNLWPSLHASASSPPQPSLNNTRNPVGIRFRNTTPPSDLLAMVDRVREVLPHMPDELIIQDLSRTNNINLTVNNLLMMQ
ncbi:E3 ubiquitin protein ligase RIN2-like isoform X2 [Phalaenopsis equestris]|uniref:E3 ubiquitin protein ligase RIN2-like isoform X2 n=1 Tax=Phalaenopsis equestris TaxID=78828 RepID=UPI0009E4B13B|nr:E3 ubiquitin protein ligase RIN2-like isoform X2 [Phalaenopsis equestris]